MFTFTFDQLVVQVAHEIILGCDTMDSKDLLYYTSLKRINRKKLRNEVKRYIKIHFDSNDENLCIWDTEFIRSQFKYWFPDLGYKKVSKNTIKKRLKAGKKACPNCGSYHHQWKQEGDRRTLYCYHCNKKLKALHVDYPFMATFDIWKKLNKKSYISINKI